MTRNSKWIEVGHVGQPLSTVARDVLAARLERVWHFLPLAALRSEEDVEYVHQVRVASRRAVAALQLFKELLPRKRRKSMRRALKRIRRAAGAARDDDVLAPRLARLASQSPDNGIAGLLDVVRRHRHQSQQAIVDVHARLVERRFAERIDELVARVRWRGKGPEPTYAEAAVTALRPAAADFLAAAEADLECPEALHALRIAGKRLRYTMEVYAAAFPAPFRSELYTPIKKLQELLGEVNDHHAAERRFRRAHDERPSGNVGAALEEMVGVEKAAFVRSRFDFQRWWTPERVATVREQLARYA